MRRLFLEIEAGGYHDPEVKMSSIVSAVNGLGESALFLAAKKGKADVVKELLKHYSREGVLSKSKDGFNPLHIAAFQGHAGNMSHKNDSSPSYI